MGSGFIVECPPAITSGCAFVRSAAKMGTPPRSNRWRPWVPPLVISSTASLAVAMLSQADDTLFCNRGAIVNFHQAVNICTGLK